MSNWPIGMGVLTRQLRLDGWLMLGVLLLMAIGLVTIYSAGELSNELVYRQGIRYGLSVLLMLVISQLPPSLYRLWTPWIYLGGIMLLLLVLLMGEGRGANRWLDLGLIRFQPSEVMKLAIPMMLAWSLHGRKLPLEPGMLLLLVTLTLVPVVLITLQPDLGTALLVLASGIFVIFLSGLSWRVIVFAVISAAASVPLVWYLLHEYQRNRIRTFLDPESDPLGNGWNVIQSMTAVGSGGFAGKGWLQGTQSHLEFLPEPHTDFVLAVFAEEFGWVGISILFTLYAAIILRGLYIASQARDTYARLLAGSLILTFFVYLMVNSSMVSGLLPVVGVPLPMISYGGTSAVTLAAGFGILLSIHGHRKVW